MARSHGTRRGPQQGDDCARLSAALAALGVATAAVEPLEDRVHAALVCGWRATGRAPSLTDIARELGVSRGGVEHAAAKLVAAGRCLHPRKALYVPVVG